MRLLIICGNAWNIPLKLSETCTRRSVPTDHRLVFGLALPGDSLSAVSDPLNAQIHVACKMQLDEQGRSPDQNMVQEEKTEQARQHQNVSPMHDYEMQKRTTMCLTID